MTVTPNQTSYNAMSKRQRSIFEYSPKKIKKERRDDSASETDVTCPVCLVPIASFSMEERIRHVEDCLSVTAISAGDFYQLGPVEEVSRTELRKRPQFLQSQSIEIDYIESNPSKRKARVEIQKQDIAKTELTENIKNEVFSEVLFAPKQNSRSSLPAPKLLQRKKETKTIFGAQKDRQKYVNVAPKPQRQREPKVEEALTELLPCSRKTPIPELKILTFEKNASSSYKVSVDAFSFMPHAEISQYFLSHFHSDHYGGISKRWCSERTIDSKIIFCSPITARLLSIRFKVDFRFIVQLELTTRYKVRDYQESDLECQESIETSPGLYVTLLDANHCPGAVIFLFESVNMAGHKTFTLHCGDFRISKSMIEQLHHFQLDGDLELDKVYLDTTYMSPKYNFPKQELVCETVADMFSQLISEESLFNTWFGSLQSRITDYFVFGKRSKKKKFLILVGLYLIGKEKLAMKILKLLGNCPIFVSNINSRGDKSDILLAYHDAYLDQVITEDEIGPDNIQAMVHLVPMKIVGSAPELTNYFNHNQYFHHFERCVGLRPTGWAFEFEQNAAASTILEPEDEIPAVETQDVSLAATLNLFRMKPSYSIMDILKQNPRSDKKLDRLVFKIYSVPYSEHSSYRELSFFAVLLNIKEIIPTVNTSEEWCRHRMDTIITKWEKLRNIKKTHQSYFPSEFVKSIYELGLEDF